MGSSEHSLCIPRAVRVLTASPGGRRHVTSLPTKPMGQDLCFRVWAGTDIRASCKSSLKGQALTWCHLLAAYSSTKLFCVQGQAWGSHCCFLLGG